jgi:radical SAM protein with 4Fe4S-binding SPASM domain
MSDNYANVRRVLNEAQKNRLKNHTPSVIDQEGTLVTSVETINISGKGQKSNKLVTVLPKSEETAVPFTQAEDLFKDLVQVNAMLTNACNLACSYCYEQHNKDFGRFTKESLKQVYDWMNARNNGQKKVFQFFGGEPLIHKPLIKEFIETYDEELSSNYNDYRGTYISMCTNGLLLNDEFTEFYFSKPYTHMMISLDTFNSTIDHREITPSQMNKLRGIIKKAIDTVNDPMRVVIRATLSEETSRDMGNFIDELYSLGVRNMVVHPLVLDSKHGYISWKDENWQSMRSKIFNALEAYEDLYVKFSEGVGQKEDSNCMVGSHMVAIDASGDFSGCYFFTNQKSNGADIAVLGNVIQDKVYVDRYKTFQNAYNEMFETEEQCSTCDYQNACYQCPAGNLDTGSRIFRPDDMCQKIVKLYVDFQHDVNKKIFMRHVKKRAKRLSELGPKVTSAELLFFKDTYEGMASDSSMFDVYLTQLNELPSPEEVMKSWFNVSDVRDLYNTLAKYHGYPEITFHPDSDIVKCYYIQCISTIVFRHEQNSINKTSLSTLLE